jgi:hypothetical protein
MDSKKIDEKNGQAFSVDIEAGGQCYDRYFRRNRPTLGGIGQFSSENLAILFFKKPTLRSLFLAILFFKMPILRSLLWAILANFSGKIEDYILKPM